MKKWFLCALGVLMLSMSFSKMYALATPLRSGIGIGMSNIVLNSGMITFGIHADTFDASLGLSNFENIATPKTQYTIFVLDANVKSKISDSTALTIGGIVSSISGKLSGSDITANTSLGISIGVQKELEKNILLDIKALPIVVNTFSSSSSTSIFGAYLVSTTYLF